MTDFPVPGPPCTGTRNSTEISQRNWAYPMRRSALPSMSRDRSAWLLTA